MRKVAVKIVIFLIRLVYGIHPYSCDFLNRIRGRHKIILAEHAGQLKKQAYYARAAVIAMFPNDKTIPFIINLMKGFAESGFFVLGVSTKSLSSHMTEQLVPHCHYIIERLNIGYDIGSYQMGLRWIEQNQSLNDLDTLAIANDSMFYPASIADTIKALLEKKGEWLGLFENFDIRYHVQSFFEVFRAPVFRSNPFQKFWRQYKAFSSRPYAVNKGEIGLSSTLLKAGFTAVVAYNSENIKHGVMSRLSANDKDADLRQALSALRIEDANAIIALEPDKLATKLADVAEKNNPTHALGLLCNVLFNAPIKRDLCHRGMASMSDVLSLAQGFTPQEKEAMRCLMNHRGYQDSKFIKLGLKLKKAAGIV